jgi:hypothetical protein
MMTLGARQVQLPLLPLAFGVKVKSFKQLQATLFVVPSKLGSLIFKHWKQLPLVVMKA